jgi:hypothetical protein
MTSTAWWRSAEHTPPAAWQYMFEEFTNDYTADEWALAAAIFVAQYRRRHSRGPTFRELFAHLLPDTAGVPSILPAQWDASARRHATTAFRGTVVIEWRRRGFVSFDRHVPRSLRVGPSFRAQSRALNSRTRSPHARYVDECTPPRTLDRDAASDAKVDPSPSFTRTIRMTHLDLLAPSTRQIRADIPWTSLKAASPHPRTPLSARTSPLSTHRGRPANGVPASAPCATVPVRISIASRLESLLLDSLGLNPQFARAMTGARMAVLG